VAREELRREFSNGAWKRLQKTRDSKHGWGQDHYEHLLTGFGFIHRDVGGHRVYWVPDHKDIRVSIPRHGELKAYVAEQVVEQIDRLLERREQER
jgi:hypothetical protein